MVAKKKNREPQENNWLFSCPPNLPLEEIKNVLEIEKQPVIELSTRGWESIHRMANDILRKYGYSDTYFYKKNDIVTWSGLNDWMFIQGWEGKQFIGEVFLLRECHKEISANLSFFVEIVSSRVQGIQKKAHLFPSAKIAVILAGWNESYLVGNAFHRHTCWIVNPLLSSPKA